MVYEKIDTALAYLRNVTSSSYWRININVSIIIIIIVSLLNGLDIFTFPFAIVPHANEWQTQTHTYVDFSFFNISHWFSGFVFLCIHHFPFPYFDLFVCVFVSHTEQLLPSNSQHFYGLICAAVAAATKMCLFQSRSMALLNGWIPIFYRHSVALSLVFTLTLFHVFKRNKCHWN